MRELLDEKMIIKAFFFLFAPFLPPTYKGGEKKGGKKLIIMCIDK
jgi:hypothetical protein